MLTPLNFDIKSSETRVNAFHGFLRGGVPHYTIWKRVAEDVRTAESRAQTPYSLPQFGIGWMIKIQKNYASEHQIKWYPNSFWRIRLRYYEDLLKDQNFILRTDSESLTLIFNGLDNGEKNRTIVGWISELSGFDFQSRISRERETGSLIWPPDYRKLWKSRV